MKLATNNTSKTPETAARTINSQAPAGDPVTYHETEKALEHARLVAALLAGEQAVREGRTRPIEVAFAELKARSERGRPG
jgi:hypothetical protein